MTELVVHYGGGDLLPIHPYPHGEGVLVAFHVEGVTCEQCKTLLVPMLDRRQRAREAAYDSDPDNGSMHYDQGSVAAAIETATTVKFTHDILRAFIEAPDDPEEISGPLIAAFRAAGFEVVE